MDHVEPVGKNGTLLNDGKVWKVVTELGHISWLPSWFPGAKEVGEISKHAYGPAIAIAHINLIKRGNYNLRHFVFTTPIDDKTSRFRFMFAMEHSTKLDKVIDKITFSKKQKDKTYKAIALLLSGITDVVNGEDIDVWKNKIIVENPAMNSEDGPIFGYRKYLEQFL